MVWHIFISGGPELHFTKLCKQSAQWSRGNSKADLSGWCYLCACVCVGERGKHIHININNEIKCHCHSKLWLYPVFNYVLDLKLSNEMESFVIVKQKRQEPLQALELSISFKQEASEQQLAFYQRRVELLEKLLDQLRAGKALGTLCNTMTTGVNRSRNVCSENCFSVFCLI